ncbi:MAG: hypothetical protein E3K32_00950 [wastewater metagenome]|nr:hypothetical protein [Candidatus Loosdrechtia aerotolerans]
MKKRFMLLYALVIATGTGIFTWKHDIYADNTVESYHKEKPTPTRALMRVISSDTSKMLEAIMNGDYSTVISMSGKIVESSEKIMKEFFPEDGKVGEWFKETGKDPGNPEDINTVKQDFENYLKSVVDASKTVAETAKKENIIETYEDFDAMLRNACFTCHEEFRPKWPAWPEWMRITGG